VDGALPKNHLESASLESLEGTRRRKRVKKTGSLTRQTESRKGNKLGSSRAFRYLDSL